MATYNIDGYRIAAKSRNQALEAARQLKQSNATQGNWPGEKPQKRKGSLLAVAAFAVLGVSLSGCSVVPDSLDACVTHVSHPLRGAPFGPTNEEDALDTVGACAEWQISDRVTIDQSLAYKYTDGGFYGDDFVYLGRLRVKLWDKED